MGLQVGIYNHVLLIGMWDYIEVISSCSGIWGHVGNIE